MKRKGSSPEREFRGSAQRRSEEWEEDPIGRIYNDEEEKDLEDGDEEELEEDDDEEDLDDEEEYAEDEDEEDDEEDEDI